MKKKNPNEPELRILTDEEEVLRLEKSADEVADGEKNVVENVEVLRPDKEARLKAKTFEPDVADILDKDEVEVDLEADWGGETKKAPPMGWFVLAGMVLCALGLWATLNVFDAQSEIEETVEKKQTLVKDRIKEDKEVRKVLLGMQDCVRGYLMARSVEEKLKYVRHPERVKPLLEDYYKRHEMKPEKFRQFERIRPMGLDKFSFVYGLVELESGDQHQLLIEQLEDGSFRVDWESDVCYLPVDWKDYLKGKNKESVVMRVFIEPDTFFAYEFSDETRYDCYKLTTRDADDHLFGFVEKGSKVAEDIGHFIKHVQEFGSDNPEPLMLRIRFPENTRSKKCVWIEDLVAPRWIYAAPPPKE